MNQESRKIEEVIKKFFQETGLGIEVDVQSVKDFTIPVNLSDVWTNILPAGQAVPPITFNESQKYATSLGLALRPFYN